MRRVALILATLGILCLAVGQAQAHVYHHGYGGYHHGYYGPVVVRPPVWVAPPVVVRPRVVYPPVYPSGCYYDYPSSGFYYQGPRVSVGVGF
jgi:hypothetical protein